MKNVKTLLSVFFLFVFFNINGQNKPDFIEARRNGYFYKQEKTNKRELSTILKMDKEASIYYRKYKMNRNIGRAASIVGVYLGTTKIIAFAQGVGEGATPEFGPKFLNFPFSGTAFIFLGSIFYGFGVNRFRVGVDIYNKNLKNKTELGVAPMRLDFGLAKHGVGLTFEF